MFSGRRAVVTGASSGIGFALCQKLALLGYGITMVARNEARLMQNLKILDHSAGQRHQYAVVDLEQITSHEYREKSLKDLFLDASLLVNCAGITNHNVLTRLAPEGIAATLNTNLLAPILLSKMAIMPFLRTLKKSKVVPSVLNISLMLSVSGVAVAGTAPYAALKAGLLGFTQALSTELNGKIRVNAVLPALVPETDMGKSGSSKLPTVSLEAVVDVCEKAVTDEKMNGQFLVADGKGFRFLSVD